MQTLLLQKLVEQLGILSHFHSLKPFAKLKVISVLIMSCTFTVHLIPYLRAAGELKTKPTQHSVKEFRGLGIQPNILLLVLKSQFHKI